MANDTPFHGSPLIWLYGKSDYFFHTKKSYSLNAFSSLSLAYLAPSGSPLLSLYILVYFCYPKMKKATFAKK